MAGFKYLAVDSDGRTRNGVVEADNPRQVRLTLREQGLIAVEVDSLSHQSLSAGRWPWRRFPLSELCLATRQMATLLDSGLTLEQTLTALIEQAETDYLRQVLAGVKSEVLAGQTLARAMAEYPGVFSELYRTLVQSGEQSGQLPRVLARLADYLEQRQALRQKVGLALIYPALVMLVAACVVAGLLGYVLPQVVTVFQNSHQTLPFLTRALLALSGFFRATWIYWLVILGAVLFGVRGALDNPDVRYRFHLWLLKLPLAGSLVRGHNTARLAHTLAVLVDSGVPLLAALRAGAGVLRNLPMRNALESAVDVVREGGVLSRALARSGMFPPLMTHLIASGETSGRLGQMFEKIALQQSQELEVRLERLTRLLEPLAILVMGLVVLVMVLAILAPIIQMNQLVK